MLTRRGWAITGILILLFFIAWGVQVRLLYLLCSLLLSILCVSFLSSRFALHQIRCSRNMEVRAFEGELLKVEFSIENLGLFPKHFLQVVDLFTAGPPDEIEQSSFIVRLKRRQLLKWSYSAQCFKRGIYNIGPSKVVGSDPLGLFSLNKDLGKALRLVVYPVVFNIRYLPLLLKGMTPRFGSQSRRRSGDYEEFYGIREYCREDGLRKIHWRSTAKYGELMVRHLEQSTSLQVTVILDLKEGHDIGSGKQTTLEYAVKLAGSVAKHLIDKGAWVQLVIPGGEPTMLPFGRGTSHFLQILELLAAVQANGTRSLGDVLTEFGSVIPANSTLIVVMLDIDQEAMRSLAQFKAKGVGVIRFVLMTSTFAHSPKTIGEAFEPEGLQTYTYYISCEDDLERKFEQPLE